MRRREFLYGAGMVGAAGVVPSWMVGRGNSNSNSRFPSGMTTKKTGNGDGGSNGNSDSNDEVLRGTLSVDFGAKVAEVPADYVGLSYESAQLANPEFFAAGNVGLIGLFKELGAAGVLRLGGGTSEFTAFTREEVAGPAPFDAVGPDTSKNVKGDTPITLKALRNLRGFLDACGWRCLYGLNGGRGSVDRAVDEAAAVFEALGPRLIAFQLGNEPDAWRNRYRPATWTYEDYRGEWVAARAAVLKRVPGAKFAGPDVSNKVAYVTGFAADAKAHWPEVVMLTSHYYAMGPAGAKDVNLAKLLGVDAKLERDLKVIMEAARGAGLPYRMDEGNSCWNGGQEGVSDTLASALWVVDMMMDFAAGGCAGVNLHGGGKGFYTPIAGSLAEGFVRRPEFFGMMLAQEFVGGTVVSSRLECGDADVRAYAALKDGEKMVLLVNKTEREVEVRVPMERAKARWVLSGPGMGAKEGVGVVKGVGGVLRGELRVGAASAVLVRG